MVTEGGVNMFSAKVEQALRRAGWTPNRQIDISPYIEALKKEGYDDIPEVLKAFLSEFGGLYFVVPDRKYSKSLMDNDWENKKFYESKRGIHIRKPWFIHSTPVLFKDLRINNKRLFFDVKELMYFDPKKALGISNEAPPMTKEDIYEPKVKEDIIIFGEVWNGYFELYMTPSGKVYVSDNGSIALLGNNYIEMFENFFNKDFKYDWIDIN